MTGGTTIRVAIVVGDRVQRQRLAELVAGTDELVLDLEPTADQYQVTVRSARGGDGEHAVAAQVVARVRELGPAPEPAAALALTATEIEVLASLARGHTYREVADLRGISHHTVAGHVKAIYRKLAVKSKTAAVMEAVQRGLIRVADE